MTRQPEHQGSQTRPWAYLVHCCRNSETVLERVVATLLRAAVTVDTGDNGLSEKENLPVLEGPSSGDQANPLVLFNKGVAWTGTPLKSP